MNDPPWGQVVEDDIECLQDRLTRAVAAKELLELQLSEPVAPSHASAWLGRAVWGAERTWGGYPLVAIYSGFSH